MYFKLFVVFLAVSLPSLKAQGTTQPCDNDDIACIRRYFSANSRCDPRVFGKMPSPFYGYDRRFKVPYFNITQNNQQIINKNLGNCTVAAFTTNKEEKTTILGIDCENVRIESESAIIAHSLGRVDKVFFLKIVAEFDVIRLTMNLHGNKDINICSETAYAFPSVPTLFLQGRNRASVDFIRNDPSGIFGDDLPIYVRELFADWATPVMEAWVNNVICDFNCNYKRRL